MHTRPECLVCFMRQALATARRCSDDPELHSRVVLEIGSMLDRFRPELSPPENAVALYARIAELTGVQDPFAAIKSESNRLALSLRDQVRDQIFGADDPLRAAIHFAACGNIIDYAAQRDFDPSRALSRCHENVFVHDDFDQFRKRIAPGVHILLLADNCGEIVFDGLLVEQLQLLGCQVTVAVRGQTIINDATMDDARFCGLTDLCPVIDNGTGCPGTPLAQCSDRFRKVFFRADLIISKGMGNFETLAEVDAPLFFLFLVKCSRVADHLNKRLHRRGQPVIQPDGDMIFLRQSR